MLKDFTFEIWVPNFRWIAAHLMQRNTPNYSRTSVSLVNGGRPNRMEVVSMGRMGGNIRAYTPRGPCCELLSVFGPRSERQESTVVLTWVPRLAVCAQVVPRYGLDQIVKDLFVTRLLALAQDTGHV